MSTATASGERFVRMAEDVILARRDLRNGVLYGLACIALFVMMPFLCIWAYQGWLHFGIPELVSTAQAVIVGIALVILDIALGSASFWSIESYVDRTERFRR